MLLDKAIHKAAMVLLMTGMLVGSSIAGGDGSNLGYQVKASVTKAAVYSVYADLNGDRVRDKVTYQYSSATKLLKITINGKSLSYPNFWFGDLIYDSDLEYLKKNIQIIDLDKSDKLREIQVTIPGSHGSWTVLLYYNKMPIKMGTTRYLTYSGNGEIVEHLFCDSMIYSYTKVYKLNSKHLLEEIKPDYYKADHKYTIIAKGPIRLYDKNKTTLIGTLEREAEAELLGEDDQKWYIIGTTAGIEGWVNPAEAGNVFEAFTFKDPIAIP